MVEGYEITEADKTWTMKLREGLLFHDGEKLLARDCVASLKRWMKRDPIGQTITARLVALEALDDRTLVFRLKKPFASLAAALAKTQPSPVIMPERLANTDAFKQIPEVIGSGPFRFLAKEFVTGSFAAYEKFDKYLSRNEPVSFAAGGHRALVDRVEWKIIPDAATASSGPRARAKVRTAKPGRYGDGRGLYLLIRPNGTRFWIFRYRVAGKLREMGLGSADLFPLVDARQRATDLFRKVKLGTDPLAERDAEKIAAGQAIAFGEVADHYITAHEAGWRNVKHRQQWHNTIDTYAAPIHAKLAVAAIDTGAVMRVLEPVWREKPETASRVRGRIEAVMDFATARGWRSGDNPARWRDHLDNLLPAPSKVARVGHHAALPWREIGLNIDEQSVDWGTVVQRRTSREPLDKGGWSMFPLGAPAGDYGDPIFTTITRSNARMPSSAGRVMKNWKPCGIPGWTVMTQPNGRCSTKKSSCARSKPCP